MKLSIFFFFASSEGVPELTAGLPAESAVQLRDFIQEPAPSSVLCAQMSSSGSVLAVLLGIPSSCDPEEGTRPVHRRDQSCRVGISSRFFI